MTIIEDRPVLDRTPPQDIAAEMAVLGGMLLSKRAIGDVTDVLSGADFYRPTHEMIYDAIVDLHNRNEPADTITVADLLLKRGELTKVGGAAYLHQLMDSVPVAANAAYYTKPVFECAVRRRMIESGTRIAQSAYETTDGTDLAAIVDQAQKETHALMPTREQATDKSQAASLARVLGSVENPTALGLPTGFADLDALTGGLHPSQSIIIAARPAIGKALALDTPLPTPAGWTTMGDVQVGDQLIGADGRPTTITAATDVMHGRPCYEVEFSDGTVIVADAEHQWLTKPRSARRKPSSAGSVATTRTIAETLLCNTADRRPNHSVDNAKPLNLPEADLLVAPYTLGAWLGDGMTVGARITAPDIEVITEIQKDGYSTVAGAGLNYGIHLPPKPLPPMRDCIGCGAEFQPKNHHVRTCGQSCGRSLAARAEFAATGVPTPACTDCQKSTVGATGICQECRDDHGSVQALLRKIGVLGNKHIPPAYLRASEAQRRALLAGLLDTDGYCSKLGTVQFAVTRERLARDFFELVLSLGYRPSLTSKPATLYGKDCGTAWTITFTTSDRVFRLPRKANRLRETVGAVNGYRYITDVRPIESVPVRCVQVDNGDHLYLASRAFIPTHNSTLGLDICRHVSVKLGRPSAFFSLEMDQDEITKREVSAEAGVPLHHLRYGKATDDDWNRVNKHAGAIASAPLHVVDTPGMSVQQIRTEARRMIEKHGLDLIVVDYLQLLSTGTTRRSENRQQEVSEMSRSLKLMAKELKIPVIAICQLNRGPEARADKKPMMSDLRESGSLEQDADVVILLHREDAYERESPRAGEADLIVAKHRNGPTATITVAFQGHYARFVDMAQS